MKLSKKFIKTSLFLLICVTLFSGCILSLIPLPEIKTTIKLFSANIPANSFEGYYENKIVDIGSVCSSSGFDIESLRKTAIEEIQKLNLSRWVIQLLTEAVERIKLKSVRIEKITLKATEGDFSKINKVSAKININSSSEIDLGEGKISDDKKEIIFDKEIEALEYVNKNSSEQTCVKGSLTITGTLGTQEIKFDGIFDLSIKVSF